MEPYVTSVIKVPDECVNEEPSGGVVPALNQVDLTPFIL